jgi:hypothetical protein
MSNLHMEALSDAELIEVADQALASLNARFSDPDHVAEQHPNAEADELRGAIEHACEGWDLFADYFRRP